MSDLDSRTTCFNNKEKDTFRRNEVNTHKNIQSKLAQTHVALTGPTRQQVLQLIMTRLESKLAQTHVALTGLTRQ